ncbi:hypothetical protein [Acidimangrovimonas sediminis]|uniref:hypothetical protein n=1 Tax=Acidimangrovimonas sediminis TaxID=2056283 RepID=UPI001E2CE024|nr:hypothetical protein [Acidimangrovimonas sediminis]
MLHALRARKRATLRAVVAVSCLSMLAACAGKGDLNKPPPPLGQFKLGLNIVVAEGAQKSPVSRDAKASEWEAALKKAMKDRFGRYDGDRFYDFGIKVDGYALAPPGIPVVLSPKSVLVITANIWDDPTQTKLNAKGKQFVVTEGLNGETVVGSGLLQNQHTQMDRLAYNAVKKIEGWLLQHPEWFPAEGAGMPENADGSHGTVPAKEPTKAELAKRAREAAKATSAPAAASGGTVTTLSPTAAGGSAGANTAAPAATKATTRTRTSKGASGKTVLPLPMVDQTLP